MARSRRNRRRDNNTIAKRQFARHQRFFYTSPKTKNWIRPNPYLTYFEDRRQWHPEGFYRPAASFSQARHRLELLDQPQRSPPRHTNYQSWRTPYIRSNFSKHLAYRIGFQQPDRVLICVRRSIRREVLHALKKTGKGRGAKKPPRFNYYSTISCRRT